MATSVATMVFAAARAARNSGAGNLGIASGATSAGLIGTFLIPAKVALKQEVRAAWSAGVDSADAPTLVGERQVLAHRLKVERGLEPRGAEELQRRRGVGGCGVDASE